MRRIEERQEDPASLDELAELAGLSPSHFQRVFSQWVGVSPKRYEQYLRLDHARTLLANRHTVLDATYAAGLSGPGRLHDLFVRWEAMAPGEYATGGEGLSLNYGWFDTPFGDALAVASGRGLCGLAFTSEIGREPALTEMTKRWPNATLREDASAPRPHVEAAFTSGKAELHVIGAPFQIKVWEALLRIPSGHVSTYGDIAGAIGSPKAVRAVGTAVGRNPIGVLIPCHRAIRKSGELGGYHWGTPVKRAVLAWESARLEAAEVA
ncbi:methylated-DNA--[protein]-cysteine S-methyltransferase [Pontivivens insulae]|nr:bifunctional helix-turn-helix domain-containing protein/methylated-DNA--[protein]-cysteine S-methyltransferase [Pontivivens insulae]